VAGFRYLVTDGFAAVGDKRHARARALYLLECLGQHAGVVLRQPISEEWGGNSHGKTGSAIGNE
jgi:hypothetical protein